MDAFLPSCQDWFICRINITYFISLKIHWTDRLWNKWLNFSVDLDSECLPLDSYCFLQLWTKQKWIWLQIIEPAENWHWYDLCHYCCKSKSWNDLPWPKEVLSFLNCCQSVIHQLCIFQLTGLLPPSATAVSLASVTIMWLLLFFIEFYSLKLCVCSQLLSQCCNCRIYGLLTTAALFVSDVSISAAKTCCSDCDPKANWQCYFFQWDTRERIGVPCDNVAPLSIVVLLKIPLVLIFPLCIKFIFEPLTPHLVLSDLRCSPTLMSVMSFIKRRDLLSLTISCSLSDVVGGYSLHPFSAGP